MLDITLSIGLSALSVLWGFIGAYIAMKRLVKPEIILQFSDVLMDEITNNIEYQQKLYLIGGLVGQGLQKGLGLTKPTGKFKWQDAFGQLAVGFVQNMLGRAVQQPQPQPESVLGKSF